MMPTYAPTSVWYVDHFTGVCKHTASGVIMPHYISTTYADPAECCGGSFDTEKCEEALPEDALTVETSEPTSSHVPTSSLVPTPGPKYYVDHFSQTCITAGNETLPHWIREDQTFDDPAVCCETVPEWLVEKCLEASVPVVPTAMPVTLEPTYSPTPYFTGPPSPAPFPAPSPSPTLITESPTADDCTDRKWRYRGRGCTNRPRHPDEPTSNFLFESAAECCHTMFFAGGVEECRVDDACMREPLEGLTADDLGARPSPSCGTTWHPDRRTMDGCTNDGDVPATWDGKGDELFFGSAFECCESVYLDRDFDCTVRDACLVGTGGTDAPSAGPRTEEPTAREAVRVVGADEWCATAEWYLDADA